MLGKAVKTGNTSQWMKETVWFKYGANQEVTTTEQTVQYSEEGSLGWLDWWLPAPSITEILSEHQ